MKLLQNLQNCMRTVTLNSGFGLIYKTASKHYAIATGFQLLSLHDLYTKTQFVRRSLPIEVIQRDPATRIPENIINAFEYTTCTIIT